jgi:hypothetical protein
MNQISDEGLGTLILGLFRGYAGDERFPVQVRGFEEVYDEDDNVEAFRIITRSGLRYRVSVVLEDGS